LLSLLPFLLSAEPPGNTIRGKVRNLTRDTPGAGDKVILLRFDRGMQAEAATEADAQGAFSFEARQPDGSYVVRAIHHGVEYDQPASAGGEVAINVFDAAPRVRGVNGSIEILRADANGEVLHIADMYEIRNDSRPPVTQAGRLTFEVFLPADARIESVLAAGPSGTRTPISAAPVAGEAGHYSIAYPIQPGATDFVFNYEVRYRGHATFQTKRMYPVQQLAVMVPTTMKFSSRSSAFRVLSAGDPEYQIEATQALEAGEGPEFEVAGTLPAVTGAESAATIPAIRTPATPEPAASQALVSSAQPSSSQSIVLSGTTGVLILISALLVRRSCRSRQGLDDHR